MNGSDNSQKNILTRSDGATIAYDRITGNGPGVVFLHGLKSDRGGTKAAHLLKYCAATGRPFVAFDMYGHGDSSGDFIDGSISRWTDDALAVIDNLTDGPQVLIGSSMGGWIMMKAALARPDRINGLIGIAAAPDFTETLIWDTISKEQQDTVMATGRLTMPSEYQEEPYDIGLGLIEDGRSNLLLHKPILFTGPVRLLQGLVDEDVPWHVSVTTADCLTSQDVTVTLIKDGKHNLSRPSDLDILTETLESVLTKAINQ
ncbi:MAG: alpha/beta fold hydrolase [Alphaproteobacteria bacterium]|nr:alpha/beta fold hydrolase [Alphaproteobacteria bacterium]